MFSQALWIAGASLFSTVVASSNQTDYQTSPPGLFPHIADTTHASQALVAFLEGYFTAKNLHEPSAWTPYFHPTQAVYGDVGLGNLFAQPELSPVIETLVGNWGPDSRSYPLRIIGDDNSALVYMVDTPDMFGDELRILVSLDFKDGVIVREVDYWDPRRNTAADANRVANKQYPLNFSDTVVEAPPNQAIAGVVGSLSTALQSGNGSLVAEFMTADAVLEDFSLRARLDGRRAISRYFDRALASLPYGVGSAVQHVVGSAQGGGYEWVGASSAAGRYGITAIELNDEGLVTKLTVVWDTFNASESTMEALAKLSTEP